MKKYLTIFAALFWCLLMGCSLDVNASVNPGEKAITAHSDSTVDATCMELVILLHGFARTSRNMRTMKQYLEANGYEVATPDIPATFGSLESCTEEFEEFFNSIEGNYRRIHFVGHSLGGLVIRTFFSRNNVPNPGRCVLIATPNQGTNLAGIVRRYLNPIFRICKPYRSFVPGALEIQPPMNIPPPEIGVIAGNRNKLLFGSLVEGENDGRVPVKSVPFEGMKASIVLPYNHHEIHKKARTAESVIRFLKNGAFE